MNQTLKGFIGSYLNVEVAHDGIESQIRDSVQAFGPAYADSLKEGFEEVLATRELSVDDYDGLTYIEFQSDDALYAYLQEMYDFLFHGAETPPAPPK